MEKITAINDGINSFVWGKGVWLLIATGVLMTLITKVFQISHIGELELIGLSLHIPFQGCFITLIQKCNVLDIMLDS